MVTTRSADVFSVTASARFRRAQRTATGGIMIGLGTYLAVSKSE
jgi:uncharacterized membrane protein YedE/YeeE